MNSAMHLAVKNSAARKVRPLTKANASAILIIATALAGGCTHLPPTPDDPENYRQTKVDGPGVLALVVHGKAEKTRDLPKSRIGNPAKYEVFGQTYQVLDTAKGFEESGVASWYGTKFHGRKTSSGETYNMYNMTAAHKHLPLPTFVLVTNVDNGKQLVVKVNDRGPFVGDRVIDLSYGAAARLGVLDTGTANVKLEAVSSHQPKTDSTRTDVLIAGKADRPAPVPTSAAVSILNSQAANQRDQNGNVRQRQPVNVRKAAAAIAATPNVTPAANSGTSANFEPRLQRRSANTSSAYIEPSLTRQSVVSDTPRVTNASGMVIQVGAFSERQNAEAMRQRVNRAVSDNAAIISLDDDRQLHKVQIGPLPAEAPIEEILSRLRLAGIDRIRLFEI